MTETRGPMLQLFLLYFCLSALVVPTLSFNYTGFLVDNLCWNRPAHIGIDGVKLDEQPEKHWLHCLILTTPSCDDAYSFLEEYIENDGSKKYKIKYALDTQSNQAAKTFFLSELSKGDRRFNNMVKVMGTLDTAHNRITDAQFELAPAQTSPTPPPAPLTPSIASTPIPSANEVNDLSIVYGIGITVLSASFIAIFIYTWRQLEKEDDETLNKTPYEEEVAQQKINPAVDL